MQPLQVTVDEPELVKPIEATTVHPSDEKLFLHDFEQQLVFHADTLLVYEAQCFAGDPVGILRDALAKVLVPYYMVAGRYYNDHGRVALDCNGAGVVFAGARCESTISDLGDLRVPSPEHKKLIFYPDPEEIHDMADIPMLTVQVTRFSCGGVVVGTLMSHVIFDGMGSGDFHVCWSRIARGEKVSVVLNPDRSAFRARSPPTPVFPHPELVSLPEKPAKFLYEAGNKGILLSVPKAFQNDKVVAKIFSFTPEKLAKLKSMALEDGLLTKCTSFEALTAYVWKAKALCLRDEEEPSKKSTLIIPVNVRAKMRALGLPENYMGNGLAYAACGETTCEELCTKPLSFCTKKIQDAIAAVDVEYTMSQIDWCAKWRGAVSFWGGMVVTSLSRLPFHELDFGWGKPVYVIPNPGNQFELPEYVHLLSSCKGDGGIDARMCADVRRMPLLEELMNI